MGISGRISALFLQSQITPLIALAGLLMGVFALVVTPREEEPEVDVTLVDIIVPFPGASARDVETLVTGPAERLLSRVRGVDHIVSVARAESALITVQFIVGENPTEALVRLYDTINSNRNWLDPALGAGEPLIKSRAIDDIPVFNIALWTRDPQRSAYDLAQIAHSLEPELKHIQGTRDVVTLGGPRRALRILLDPQRLNAHGITALDLRNKLQLASQSQTAGTLLSGGQEILIRAGEPFESADDVSRLVVGVQNGRPVFLSEVASVIDGPEQAKGYTWFGLGPASVSGDNETNDIHPAVTLTVSKMRGVNAANLTPLIHERLDQLRGVLIPQGVEFTITRDYGKNASEKAQLLIFKLVFITLLVSGMVLFVLGWREAIVIGLAVTLTLMLTFFASWVAGITINRVALFALIFSVGFLVDDAIVVVENVHRWRVRYPEQRLLDIIPAAVDEVGGPTILATFTVIFSLLPIAFVPGLMGSFMRPIPIDASMGMFLSLLVAFVVTPWLTLRIFSTARHLGVHSEPAAGRFQTAVNGLMRKTISHLIDEERGRKRRRALYLAVSVAITAALSLPVFNLVLLNLLTVDNQSEFVVALDMPIGTPVETTANVLFEITDLLREVPEVTRYQIYAGTPGPINLLGLVRQYYLRQSPEVGLIQVNLLDRRQRKRQSHAIATSLHASVEAIARRHGGDARIAESPPGPPVVSPIVAEIYGPDYAGQRAVARFVRSVFDSTPDVISVFDSLGSGGQRSTLRIRADKAALLGVEQKDINEVLRIGLGGTDISRLAEKPVETGVPIRISLPPQSAGSMQDLLNLKLRAANGALVAVSELVDVVPGIRDEAIYHKDSRPVVFVFGDFGGKRDSALYGMFDIRSRLQELAAHEPSLINGRLDDYLISMPTDVYAGYSVKWDGDWDINFKTFRNLGGAYVIGLGFIYLLLVAYFKSYVTPLLIMAPIPLTIIGVLPGHWVFGSAFTASSVIGMAALAGIMVRNSILLVQFIDEQVGAGVPLREAVIESTIVRARPIALAGLAAMLGAVLLLEDPIFGGLAISLLCGVSAATALTLLLLPPLYYGLLQKRQRKQQNLRERSS